MSEKPKLLVMSKAALSSARQALEAFDIIKYWELDKDGNDLKTVGTGIRAILAAGFETVGAGLLDSLPELKLIAVIAAGFNGIDVASVRAAGITLTNGSGVNSDDVADHALAMMMAVRNDIRGDDAWVRSGQWQAEGRRPFRHSLRIEKAGIVGFGHIGQAIAARLIPISMGIAWSGPRPKDTPYPYFDDLTAMADWATILFVACRGGPETAHLIGRRVMEALGPHGLIVNVSRGTVIDEAEMIMALKDGRLGAAALDVFDPEPTSADRWRDVPNTLLAPHVAGATRESVAEASAAAVENARRAYTGQAFINVADI